MLQEDVELGQDDLGGFGPDEGFGAGVVLGEISIDGGLQVDDRAEHTTADALPRHLGEEVLDRVEPGGRGRCEMEGPARMARQPSQHLGMFVGGMVVEHRVDQLASWDLALDSIEKAVEFEVEMALHAAADHRAVEHAERGEQGGGAVPPVIVRHGLAAPRFDRQSRLRAIEGLDLALFVNRQHNRMGRRIDIEPDDVSELASKAWIARALEGAQPMRLQFVSPPDALYRTY